MFNIFVSIQLQPAHCLCFLLTVQGKCKANAESSLLVLLSRSLYSPLQILVCKGKGTKFIFGFESSCKLLKIVAIFSVFFFVFLDFFITFADDFEKACEPRIY